MSVIRIGFVVVLVSSIVCVHAQFPFMDGFFQNMNNMMGNIQRMTSNMAAMGQNMYSEHMARARAAGAGLRPGERRVFNDGNTRGYAYRSRDGGFSYSFSSGSPGSHGYMFHSGPDGTYERRW